MTDIPKFTAAQRDFIHQALIAEAPIPKIIDDLTEIYPQFTEEKDTRTTLSERITKMKARMPEAEKKEAWETRPHYLSARWRLAYFRALLEQTEDVTQKIRLLGEIRKEVNTIDQQNKAEEPIRKKAADKQRYRKLDASVPIDNPQDEADQDGMDMIDMTHEDTQPESQYRYTPLAIKSYEKLDHNRYRRKDDDVVIEKETLKTQGKKHT